MNFKFEKAGKAIGLFAPEGVLIDGVTFPAQVSNWSQGRVPDGAAGLHFFVTPSPLATNTIAPAPEIIAVQRLPADAISFTWRATPGRLYRIEATDPLEDPAWTPLSGDAPATTPSNSFTALIGARLQRFYRVVQVD